MAAQQTGNASDSDLKSSSEGLQAPFDGQFRDKIQIRLDSQLWLRKKDLPDEVVDILKKRLIWKNPRYERDLRFGRKTPGITSHLFCLWEEGEFLTMPRGFAGELIKIFHSQRVPFEFADRCFEAPAVEFNFNGQLYGYQQDAFQDMKKKRHGILAGPIGCGKKVIALDLISSRGVPALVVVKSRRQLYQWREMAMRFLELTNEDVGLLGDRHQRISPMVTIGTDKSIYKNIEKLRVVTGQLIIDRCNAANLKILQKIVSAFDCYYLLGLSTLSRRGDGLNDLMYAYLGKELHRIKNTSQIQGLGERNMPKLNIKPTGFDFPYSENYGDMLAALCCDCDRNDLIIMDLLEAAADPMARVLAISERIEHLETIRRLLRENYKASEIITGRTEPHVRSKICSSFGRGKPNVLLITLRSLPAIEVKRISSIFICSPMKYGGHLSEVVGRLIGTGQDRGHSTFIFDYQDEPLVLKASLRQRMKIYKDMGAQKVQ